MIETTDGRPGSPGSLVFDVVLQNADGECHAVTFDGHTPRHAAHAAEISTGEMAVAITQREPASRRIRIVGRCVRCGDLVLGTERWQRLVEGLRCEDCRR